MGQKRREGKIKNEKMKLYKNMDYALKGERGGESSKGGPREGGGGGVGNHRI